MALIHGQDASGYLKPLLVDASGNIILSQPVQIIGTNSDKLHSISDNVHVRVGSAALAAGTNILTIFTVPAGLIYNITNLAAIYIGTVLNVDLQVYITSGGNTYTVLAYYGLTSNQWRYNMVDIHCMPGEQLTFRVTGATLNDDAYCDAIGHSLHTT